MEQKQNKMAVMPMKSLVLNMSIPLMLSIGIPALRIISVTFVFAAVTIVCGYFASGLGNGVINMVGGLIRQLVLLVPFLWIFSRIFGIGGAWYAFWISETAPFLYSYFSARRLLKRKLEEIDGRK
jgi:Na+-driven multidrug efflux pump